MLRSLLPYFGFVPILIVCSQIVGADAASFRQLQSLANDGDAEAQYQLAILYDEGAVIPEDDFLAMDWYELASEQNHEGAYYNLLFLEFMYVILDENNADTQAAARWFEQKAKEGDVRAIYKLGRSYDRGFGVKKDSTLAVKWYQKAADRGHLTAQNNLAILYDRGEGVARDADKAMSLYLKAAKGGYAIAQKNVALTYYYGDEVKQDLEAAFYWFGKSAHQGNITAQNYLGIMFDNGEGTKKDPAQAYFWFEKAAAAGLPSAQNNLGILYEFGRGVERDLERASQLYLASARQGYVEGQRNIALNYQSGIGVPQDDKKCYLWASVYVRTATEENVDVDDAREIQQQCESELNAKDIFSLKIEVDKLHSTM